MTNIENRITIEPEKCGGRPCIRGMRIRVTDVLDLLASGLSKEEVVEVMPDPGMMRCYLEGLKADF